MAIVAGDLDKFLTGAGSDGGVQADPDASLGSYRSSSEIVDDTDENLFDDVEGAESEPGDTEYRCFCIQNKHGSLELQNAKVFIQEGDVGGGNSIEFAVEVPETTGLTDGDAQSIVDESTEPSDIDTTNHNGTGSGISDWSTATSYATGVSIDLGAHDVNLGVNELIFVWIKRIIGAAAPAAAAVDFTIRIEGDTAA
ncbi:MAG: hypothetical protein JRI53_01500 [Deltaproteobacteria bacterium]|nr:hypothetical protein [Deltaproteobacteria bacterium]MBW2178770.1 hypothetical protein [Deltaproteobacteria bacterium]MBW2363481.1 hypothetical protein [Deltaproteobacteria bacterium]